MNRKFACITMDIEPDLKDPQRRMRLFDDAELFESYVSIVKEYDVKVTGFVVTSLVAEYGVALNKLSNRIPIEYGVHSHSHDPTRACTPEEIEKSYQTYKTFWGDEPAGYRAPNGLINKVGLIHLLNYNFRYDSSIFPSLRLDEYGYSNLSFPTTPFQIVQGSKSILELPFACLDKIRLVFSLSYCKLLGFNTYQMLMKIFPLPDIVVLDTHPYDFYIPCIAKNLTGWKKQAHLRNGSKAFDIFEQIIRFLKSRDYEFLFMQELSATINQRSDLAKFPVDRLS